MNWLQKETKDVQSFISIDVYSHTQFIDVIFSIKLPYDDEFSHYILYVFRHIITLLLYSPIHQYSPTFTNMSSVECLEFLPQLRPVDQDKES